MPTDRNKRLVARFIETVWNDKDTRDLGALVHAPYTVHRDPGDPWDGQALDLAAFKERLDYTLGVFPDLRFTLEDSLAEGDRVLLRWRQRGTHSGDLRGLPATGRVIDVAGLTIYVVTGGKVSGHWQAYDRLGLLTQLGVIPVLDGPPPES